MRVRSRIISMIVVATVAAACGGGSASDALASTDQLQLAVRTDPQPLRSGQPGSFVLEVTSVADQPLDVRFDTSQRGDVALETENVEVYRWAAQRVFAQETHQVTLDPGARVEFRLDEFRLPVGPGAYEMLATLSGQPELQVVRVPVTVDPGSSPAAIGTPSERATDRPAAVGSQPSEGSTGSSTAGP